MKFTEILKRLDETQKTVKCKDCGKKTPYGECEHCGGYNHPFDSKKKKSTVGKEGKNLTVK